MFWKRQQGIYNTSIRKQQNPYNNPYTHTNQPPKSRNALAPIMSAPQHQASQPSTSSIESGHNPQNPKFSIRKSSKSKQSKLSSHIPGTFFLHRGNNHNIVKVVLQQLGYSESISRDQCCLIWYQGKEIPRRDFMRGDVNPRAANYLPNHSQITNKQKLYENLVRYDPSCVGTYIPKTFIVDFKDNLPKIQANLVQFMIQFFKKIGSIKKDKKNSSLFISNYYGQICIPFSKIQRTILQHRKNEPATIPESQITDQNFKKQPSPPSPPLWIVKPSFLNRGQGIQVISNLRQLQKMLSEDSQQISIRMYQSQEKNTPSSFVIQEYIMDPLLYMGYKFDVRVWILLRNSKSNGLEVYIYKQAYVRLACHKYHINEQNNKQQQNNALSDPDSIQKKAKKLSKSIQYLSPQKVPKSTKNVENDKFIHLTNNAVQKNCKQYGALYQGNQMLLPQLIQKLSIPALTTEYVYTNFKKITKKLIQSSKQKLSKSNYGSFQLMGLDFMIDSKLNIWLIQANCNPCLEQSSTILKNLIPVMLRELFSVVSIGKIMGFKGETAGDGHGMQAGDSGGWDKII